MRIRHCWFVQTLLVVALLAFVSATAVANTVHVDQAGGGDFLTIQAGIDAATYGDTVLVAPGTYREHLYMGPAADGVVLLGALGAEFTIVNNEFSYPNSVLFCENVSSNTRIEGIAFTYGYTDLHGGGIRCDSAHVQIKDVVVTDCNALEAHGGGIGGEDSNLVVQDCTIANNRGGVGGGISVNGGSLIAENNHVTGNSADYLILGQTGGGIYVSCDSGEIIDNLIEWNYARYGGGLGVKQSSNISITGNIITHNTAGNSGGGIYIFESHCIVSDNTVSINHANAVGGGAVDVGGGGGFTRYGSPEFFDNLFFGNTAITSEAAIRIHDAGTLPTFHNSFFGNGTTYELLIEDTPSPATVDFTSNWWGTENTAEIAAKIY
ncbi:right-handed parallel beta-helix repeat-containing protein, partial [bacterium]|nr:right-handed parallel beta-helix repeat-containing protein [bacterium]